MEQINLDLNNLFNLSYNFEGLKILLTSIAKNQDVMMAKIKDLEKNSKQDENKLESIISGKIKINQPLNIEENPPKENGEKKEIIKKEIIIDKKEENSFDSKEDKDNHLILIELENRIFNLENLFKDLKSFIPVYDKTQTLNDILDEHKVNIFDMNEDIKQIKEDIGNMKENVEQIKLKVSEFDIYDILKDTNISGDVDVAKLLIQSLEKKVFEKFKFDEEKIKKDEEDLLKLKNELTNLKNSSNFETRNLSFLKEQILKIPKDIEVIRTNLSQRITKNKEYIDKVKEKSSNNKKEINNNINGIKQDIQNLEERINNRFEDFENNLKKENEEENQSSEIIKNEEFNNFKDAILKRFNSLEKKINALNSDIKPEVLNEKIEELKLEFKKRKPSEKEYYDLIEKFQNQSDNIDILKNENGNTQDDVRKLREYVSVVNRKCENLILQNISSNKNDEESENNHAQKNLFLSKLDDYVETTVFAEFIKEESKIKEKFKKDIDNHKHFNEEIIETLKKAASIHDLKSLEDYLVDLFEEFKDKAYKYFPRKSDVNKNLRALELQIKQLYDLIIKKDERTDNWMLAKKPIGGFSCASCENYLGDLKENDEKVFWNQFPEHDNKDININRIGNGFSRILNMINVKNESSNDDNNILLFKSDIDKPDYGQILNKDNKKDLEINEIKNKEKTNFNSTQYNVKKRNKNIFRNNIETNTTITQPDNNNMTEETNSGFNTQRLRLTARDGTNIFKEVKGKKNEINNGLPPITLKNDENTLNLYEDAKEQKNGPKLMKIIKKKK